MPNIERRHNTWYATLHVPSDVVAVLKKRKFFQTLETTDKRTAEIRAAVIVAGWKTEIQHARGTHDPFIDEAMDWRKAITESRHPDDKEALGYGLEDRIESHIAPSYGPEKAKQFHAIASGKQTLLAPLLPKWKAQLTLAPKTIDQMHKDVTRMVARFGTAQAITRESVSDWTTDLATGTEEMSPSSIRRIVSFCRNFWQYLAKTGVVPRGDIPFETPNTAKKKGSKRKNGWVPFSPVDVVNLENEARKRGDQQLADLIQLGAYTGARIEELCSLKVADLTNESIRITDSKTLAGIREIPIHSKLIPLVGRLKKESTDEYLLSGLTFNKYGDRSNAIGKRFGRLKADQGFQAKHVFHSIRKTVVTIFENAGVSENLAADIVGHEKPRVTYGLYSEGSMLEVMRGAVEKIRYPVVKP